jgi:HD-GYP domain-containing protein (c-di-GMP phosphodiesterase class II)/DNA-binding CsgD family transcriptional regulator
VADAFLSLAGDEVFWDKLDADDPWSAVLAIEVPGPRRFIDERDLDGVCLAFADFIDLKSGRPAAHSRRTAAVAEAIARRLGKPEEEVTLARRAALVHNLGQVAVPSAILQKMDPLTAAEQERLRLHPYYTERILSPVAALRPVAAIAAMHHERPDGEGYHRGLKDGQIPAAARIVAVADRFAELTAERPGAAALDAEAAVRSMERDVGRALDGDCFRALAAEAGGVTVSPPPRREWPAGLTEREVDVLRLVARGLDRRQVAKDLYLSEHTVRHHLESTYSKIGVHSRAGAVLFAVEHNLLR